MRRLLIEVDCEGNICNNCEFPRVHSHYRSKRDDWFCGLFGSDLDDKAESPYPNAEKLLRCPECLEAERKAEGVKDEKATD
jgi:hypothetical protein